MNDKNDMLPEGAAGSYLGGVDQPITARTLQRWRFEGTGPSFVKVGRLVRYPKVALDAYLTARTRNPVAK